MGCLSVASALFDQPRHRIATLAAALVAGDLKRVELADQVAEDERAVAGYRGCLAGFHSRASFCASAIWAGVMFRAAMF